MELKRNLNTNNNSGESEKPKRKKSGCLIIFLLFILIIVLLVGIFIYNKSRKQKEYDEYLASTLLTYDVDDLLESYKDIDSDIEGMSVYDKLEYGLSAMEGSDTDGDGLSDKDELEVYHTDPLKSSTSGDSLPDGYKVAKGLDLTKSYKKKESQTYLEEFFEYDSNIIIKDKTADNASSCIREIDYKFNGLSVEKAYRIDCYKGNLELDFNDVLDLENNTYLAYSIGDAIDAEYKELKLKNGKVSLKVDENLIVFILNKNIFDGISFDSAIDVGETSGNISGNDSLIIYHPIGSLLGLNYITIMEKSLIPNLQSDRTEELNYILNKDNNYYQITHKYVSAVDYQMFKTIFDLILSGDTAVKMMVDSGEEVTEETKNQMSQFIQMFVSYKEMKSSDWKNLLNIPVYLGLESETKEEEVLVDERPSKYMTSFKFGYDEFPFPNIGTYISNGGNCSGISLITAKLFNGEELPDRVDTVEIHDKEYNYDLSDSCFDTLFDRGLYDFKNHDYFIETYGRDNLKNESYEFSNEDRQFINFLGIQWMRVNSQYSTKAVLSGKVLTDSLFSWDKIETLKTYFENNNKILLLMLLGSTGGHTINAIGLEEDENNPDCWYVRVYDNNFPNNEYYGTPVDNRIKVTKVTKRNCFTGKESYYFTYDYYPVPEKISTYRWHSGAQEGENFLGLLDIHAFYCLTSENVE